MHELESEESAEQRRNQLGQGLKIMTPDQMLSRLPITLAQLKVGNNPQKRINEIRQLLYSLYHSQKSIIIIKTTKAIYNYLINAIQKWKLFMNTENRKTNEPHRFRLSLADKLILKIQSRILR